MQLGNILLFKPIFRSLSILDRYIATEMMAPFFFGVGAFSSVGVALGTLLDLLSKVAEAELPLMAALQVILLKIPEFASYAFPISILLATLLAYNRLSNDSELIALRSCGISIYRLVTPALVFSFCITGVSFLFNELVVPEANYQANLILHHALHDSKHSLHGENILYPEYEEIIESDGYVRQELKRLFYANRFEGKNLRGLTVLDESEPGVKQVITCESAVWNSSQNNWDFFNGTIYFYSTDATQNHILHFDKQSISIPAIGLELATKRDDPFEMNISQALQYQSMLNFSSNRSKYMMFAVRIQQKIAFPFVCLVFGLLGATLGSTPHHSSRATSFGICVLMSFGYYFLMFIFGGLAIAEMISPIMAAWLPNVFGLVTGGWFLVKSN